MVHFHSNSIKEGVCSHFHGSNPNFPLPRIWALPCNFFEFLRKLLRAFFLLCRCKCWPEVLSGMVHFYDQSHVTIFPTVGLGGNTAYLIFTSWQNYIDHHFSSNWSLYWPILNFICLGHVVNPIFPVEAGVSKCDDICSLLSAVSNILVYSQGCIANKNSAQMSSAIDLSDSVWTILSTFKGRIGRVTVQDFSFDLILC